MRIANNVAELVGNTPLVKLNRLAPANGATIALKLEFFNPAHSVKDRIAVAMLDAYFAAQFEGGRHEHRIEKMAIPCGAAGDAAK